MTTVDDLRLRLRSHGPAESSCSVMLTEGRLSVAAILQEFDVHRRELMRRSTGSAGAFSGFNRLDTRPQSLLDVPDGSRVVVRTTLCEASGRQSMVQLVAYNEDDPNNLLVVGVGAAISCPIGD